MKTNQDIILEFREKNGVLYHAINPTELELWLSSVLDRVREEPLEELFNYMNGEWRDKMEKVCTQEEMGGIGLAIGGIFGWKEGLKAKQLSTLEKKEEGKV